MIKKERHFGDRLSASLRATGTPLCVGIDPHRGLLPALFTDGDPITGLRHFAMNVVEAARGLVPAVKPQAAMFEAFGPQGLAVLAETAQAAKDAGLLVIMDAKRGDIGSTSAAYAQAYLASDAPFYSDALTINPWMGLDTIMPFLEVAEAAGNGLFILVRTSNEGAADLQELPTSDETVYEHLANRLAPLATRMIGESGTSSLGIVAGATVPEQAEHLRATLPHSPFLIPGFGAQGAGPAHATIALGKEAGSFTGGLVNSSRGIIFCDAAQQAQNHEQHQAAMRDAIRTQIALLQTAY